MTAVSVGAIDKAAERGIVDAVVKEVNRLREMSPLFEMAKAGIDLKTVQWATH